MMLQRRMLFQKVLSRMRSPIYLRYSDHCQALLKKNPDLIKFNGSNPSKSFSQFLDLNHWQVLPAISEKQVFGRWKSVYRYPYDYDENHITTSIGVRSSLSGLFQVLSNRRIFMPRDVYPVYSQLIHLITKSKNSKEKEKEKENNNEHNNGYCTVNVDNFEEILEKMDREDDVLLYTDPNPLNNSSLTEYQTQRLIDWLIESEERVLIIDAVYAYHYNKFYNRLLSTNRVILCYSLSKSHLLPLTYGVIISPKGYQVNLRRKICSPDEDQLKQAYYRLMVYPKLPQAQHDLFDQEWTYLRQQEPFTKLLDTSPKVSYFSQVPIDFQALHQKHGVLGIPLEIFGSYDPNCLVSCLDSVVRRNRDYIFPKDMYHVTVLSNFHIGYDKYSMRYSKENIPNCTFPDQFHVLTENQLEIGFQKADQLLTKLAFKDNQKLVIKTTIRNQKLTPSESGLGHYIPRNYLVVDQLYLVDPAETNNTLTQISVEDAYAMSLKLFPHLSSYDQLVPRTVSLLPIAIGCQAKCPFCFSHSSISLESKQERLQEERIITILDAARERGATRAVITGGGEPMMLRFDKLCEMINFCSERFERTIMITNGYAIGSLNQTRRIQALESLDKAGLTVLSISRHAPTNEENQKIMYLDTQSEKVAETYYQEQQKGDHQAYQNLKLRWVCVLQRGGVDSPEKLAKYLSWSVKTGVSEICFKELYVATSQESVYYHRESNIWSRENQIPLKMVIDFIEENGGVKIDELPWGASIYRLRWDEFDLKIASYTEPSVYWERFHGISRSWNLLADGNCYSSLEDQTSLLKI